MVEDSKQELEEEIKKLKTKSYILNFKVKQLMSEILECIDCADDNSRDNKNYNNKIIKKAL